MKCIASTMRKGWDDKTIDVPLTCMMQKTMAHVCRDDPTRGDWCVDGEEIDAWIDTSSLVIGVVLEKDGIILDVC